MFAVWSIRFALAFGLFVAAALGALLLAVPPAYAAPIFPAAGIALALCLRWGAVAYLGTALGALLVGQWLAHMRGVDLAMALAVSVPVALGAAAQAGLGAFLVRRAVRQPLTLEAPDDILRFFLLAGPLASVVNASVASFALVQVGQVDAGAWTSSWLVWWGGDTLGVIIAAPIMLAWVGEPKDAWQPRRWTVALPMLAATAMLVFATRQIALAEQQRVEALFQDDALELAAGARVRMNAVTDTLQALQGALEGQPVVDAPAFARSVEPWIRRQPAIAAFGWIDRVPRDGLAAYASTVRGPDGAPLKVFDREDGRALVAAAGDRDAMVIRHILPAGPNDRALGVNVLSAPVAREALLAALQGEAAVLSGLFPLTQSPDTRDMVIYQAVRDLTPARQVRGAVFLTLNRGAAIETLVGPMPGYLQACVIDPAAAPGQRRVAGLPGCEEPAAADAAVLRRRTGFEFGSRALQLLIQAPLSAVPSDVNRVSSWTLTVLGIAVTSLLGALLLGTTGRAHRFEAEVADRQAALGRELEERSRAEAQARRDEQRLAAIFETVPIGLRFTDPAGRLIDANPAFCELTGYTLEELRTMDVFDLTHPADRIDDRPLFEQLVRGERPEYLRQKRYVTRSGEVRWVRVRVRLGPSPDGGEEYTIGVVEDITEHLQLLEARQARETAEAANEAKNEFLSRMSHELRTPLNSMLGFAQLLGMQERERLGSRQREWIGRIEEAGWHLLAMINDVLDLSRIEAGQMRLQIEPLDMAALLHTTLALVEPEAARRSIELHTQISPGATAAMGDATRVKQILSNMLTNAIKYNRADGAVALHARQNDAGIIEIDVIDTGLGMSAEQLEHLFQPFNRLGRERSQIEGTGIGLVISQRLAQLMGGALRVHSAVGVGTTVTLELPGAAAPRGSAAREERDPFAHSGYHHRDVYYIEDNEVNAEVMRAIVAQRPQIRMTVYPNGLDGLAAIQRSRPDLLLLDMNLPDIDGLALLQHLQADPELAAIPVVVVSADASEGQVGAGLRAGALRYLTKPLSVDEVLTTLDDVLARQDTVFG